MAKKKQLSQDAIFKMRKVIHNTTQEDVKKEQYNIDYLKCDCNNWRIVGKVRTCMNCGRRELITDSGLVYLGYM